MSKRKSVTLSRQDIRAIERTFQPDQSIGCEFAVICVIAVLIYFISIGAFKILLGA